MNKCCMQQLLLAAYSSGESFIWDVRMTRRPAMWCRAMNDGSGDNSSDQTKISMRMA